MKNVVAVRKFIVSAIVTWAAITSGPAQSTALYDAVASATLTVDSIINTTGSGLGELLIQGQALVFDEDAVAVGDATAVANGSVLPSLPLDLGIGDDIDLLAAVSGDAGATAGSGTSDAFFLTDGSVTLENQSATDTFEVAFTLAYAAAASALVDDLINEFALSLAALSLETTSGGTLLDEVIAADTVGGLPGDLVADSVSFTLMLTPGQTDAVFLLADAEGIAIAEAAVAEPATLGLMALGVALLGASSRKSTGRRNKAN